MGEHFLKIFWKVAVTFVVICPALSQSYVKYKDPAGNFSTLVYDSESENIFIGGLNKVYRLDAGDLRLIVQGDIGPKLDNPECQTPPPAECAFERTFRNNSNKLLLQFGDKIISCGTVNRGTCEFLYSSNLTNIGQLVSPPVINTDGNSVAMITQYPGGEPNLYIGTPAAIEPDLPPFTTRSLVDFEVQKSMLQKSQKKASDSHIRQGFKMDFIHGFNSNNVNYYVVVYDENYSQTTPNYQTYISHTCESDQTYKVSYIELPLVCNHNGQKYMLAQSAYLANRVPSEPNTSSLILVVTFGMSENGASSIPERKSAVCVYSLSDKIEYSFLNAYKECSQGNTTFKTVQWAGASQHVCEPNTLWEQILVDEQVPYCHYLEQIPDLGGNAPIVADAIYQEDDTLFTSVTFQYVDEVQESVIFLGDDKGDLVKLRLNSLTSAQKYETKTIDAGSAVIRNGLMLSKDNDSIYVTTKQQITKVPVEECEQYTTCSECLGVGGGVGDPYCGWCTLMNRCTRKNDNECTGAYKDGENRWLNHFDQCINITDIEPANLPSDMQIELTLTVRSLPSGTPQSYFCVFEDIKTMPVLAIDNTKESPTLTCETPPEVEIVKPDGFRKVNLSILSNETNMEFVSSEFVFYDCSAFQDCTNCVSSNFACDWCIYENECTGNSLKCKLQGVVGGKGLYREYTLNAQTNATKFGPDKCPRLKKRDTEILLSVDTKRPIEVVAQNLPMLETGQEGYECVIGEEVVRAEVMVNNTIRCEPKQYSYSDQEQEKPIVLKVRWNGNFMIDNPDKVTVTLYKCDVNRTTCGKCLLADSKYECGWCNQVMCRYKDHCQNGAPFLNGNVVCPNPKIISFSPLKGPIKGGTQLIIKGENLGLAFNDTESIMVDNVNCVTEEEGYIPSEQLQCTLSSTPTRLSSWVKVKISKESTTYSATSEEKYSFVIPEVTKIEPTLGPMSGGTDVILEGDNLDAGTSVNVTIADQPCLDIQRKEDGTIHCVTSPVITNVTIGDVVLMIDNGKDDSNVMFYYKTDPTITKILPGHAIASGGTRVQVKGLNLHVAKKKILTMTIDSQEFRGECFNASSLGVSMTCKAPNISAKFMPLEETNYMSIPEYGFILDGVTKYQSLDGEYPPFEYFVDPEYFDLEDNEYNKNEDENLIIPGRNLNLASQKEDVQVRIGKGVCEVKDIGLLHLTCKPPEDQPKSLDGSDGAAEVIVYHGNLNFSVGLLKYYKWPLPLPLEQMIAIAAILIIVILIVVGFCIYRCKAGRSEQKITQFRQQLDQLEMKVAQECKEAFAELQIEIELPTNEEYENQGIPYREFRSCILRVLFPDQPDHPILRDLPENGVRSEKVDMGLQQFGSLINNKTFLLLFIRTLESQSSFTIKDKSNVASLLIVVLQSKMDYATDILKVLLADLIEKGVDQDRARLLMRRNESVAEKFVSNWLSFLLHSYLQESAAAPLYRLFRAIKIHVERGPVDAVTADARYSLNEGKLIREILEYETLNIYAIGLDPAKDPVEVKVLSIDTIMQAKEKIMDALYKNVPYSQRPSPDTVELEWKNTSGRLTLQDENDYTKGDGEWKRLNTLSVYEIRNGASITLINKQGCNSTLTHPRYMNSHVTSSPSRSMSPMLGQGDSENSVKVCHLVKHGDNDNQEGDRGNRMVSEIFLTRLLYTKGALQKFVDELFATILNVRREAANVPLPIKYLFDYFDDQAKENGITNPEVVHAWKSNSLPLRFWVNLIKNPDVIFDIHKSDAVDACLSIIGQTLMDSCSVSEHQLTKESPSSKLLYAKDIPNYKKLVAEYYTEIQRRPAVSDQEMNRVLGDHSTKHKYDFHEQTALNELYYTYVRKYREIIMPKLEEDEIAQEQKLAYKLSEVEIAMGDLYSYTLPLKS
ncbi:plexin-A4-like [Antedon mediterranea]|uniref:plexin-A4-like n=1 Tax=Antedon mediterranea TaxID=105859 RepID=UPI003AF95194